MSWFNPAVLATGNSITAAIWNNNFGNMADTGWQPIPTYTNSWASAGGPATGGTVAGYRIIGNRVFLGGKISGGSSAAPAFTLPSGARPPYAMNLPTVTSTGGESAVVCTLTTGGVFTPTWSGNTVPTLDGMSFATD
jgi:hypothetical protein